MQTTIKQKGFTLLELIIVIVILGTLAAGFAPHVIDSNQPVTYQPAYEQNHVTQMYDTQGNLMNCTAAPKQ